MLALGKILVLSAALLGGGVLLYVFGRRRARGG